MTGKQMNGMNGVNGVNGHGVHHKPPLPKDAYCGYGDCHPRWARGLANMKTFSLNLALILLLHIGFYSYFVGVMRTMEKRFSLTSSQTGMLNSTNDFIQVCIVLFVGFAGQRANKARMLSLLILLTFVAALFYAMPYFIFGAQPIGSVITGSTNRTDTKEGPKMCHVGNSSETCGSEEEVRIIGRESNLTFIIIAIGCVAIGLGGSSNSTLGLSYIDENASKGNSSIYIGLVTSMYPWGPIVGFMLAALCTSLPESLTGPSLPREDPNFIGAWWLGFIIIGTLVFACAIPLFFFPKHMAGYYEDREDGAKETALKTGKVDEEKGMTSVFKEFPRLFSILITNKAFWTHALSQVCSLYVVVGVLIQQPRYLEAHFHQTAAMASILAAASGAISGVLGNLAGGIIMRKLKLRPTGMAMMVVIAGVVACVGTAIKLLIACPPVDMAGYRDPTNPGTLELTLPCNANCSCTQSRIEPVCVGGTKTYFSACHAGCTIHSNQTFTDCACAGNETVTAGQCDTTCNMLIPYLAGYFIITLISLTGRVPSTILTFRMVDKEMKSFALGFFSFLLNLLTFIPGPIVFGMLVDSTCLIWQETCGKTGSCLFYDIRGLRLLPHGVTLGFQALGLLLSIITWWLVKNDKKLSGAVEDTYMVTVELSEADIKPSIKQKVTST